MRDALTPRSIFSVTGTGTVTVTVTVTVTASAAGPVRCQPPTVLFNISESSP